jgi:alpha-L-rhamnosidase
MFGDVSNWFYQYVAGIRPDQNAPGFKHFFIEPKLTSTLQWAKADFESPYGKIKVDWKKQGTLLIVNINVPNNSSASLILPKGELVNSLPTIFDISKDSNEKMIFELKSGNYRITIDQKNN